MANKTIRTLRANEIECRIGTLPKSGKGLSLLLYKDARCDMAILDEVFGPMNWQRHHSRDNANCVVAIWDDDKKQWVEKEDTGVDSNTEAEKGRASDSFKRACFNWGIGRELYTAPFIWIPADKCNIEKNDRGFLTCNDKFKVSSIEYNDNHEIFSLEIVNQSSNEVVFRYTKGAQNAKKPRQKEEPPESTKQLKDEPKEQKEEVYRCRDCGDALTYMRDRSGNEWTPITLRDFSYGKYGRVLCPRCMKAEEAKQAADKESA